MKPMPMAGLISILVAVSAFFAFACAAVEDDSNRAAFANGYGYAYDHNARTVQDCQHYAKMGEGSLHYEGFWIAGCYDAVRETQAK